MIYEYKCHDCGQVSEFWMKMSDPAPTECPACKGSRLERLISKTSFALKGSGWYTTDYKRAGGTSATKSDKSEGSTTETKSSTESPTTPSTGGGCGSGNCGHNHGGKKD